MSDVPPQEIPQEEGQMVVQDEEQLIIAKQNKEVTKSLKEIGAYKRPPVHIRYFMGLIATKLFGEDPSITEWENMAPYVEGGQFHEKMNTFNPEDLAGSNPNDRDDLVRTAWELKAVNKSARPLCEWVLAVCQEIPLPEEPEPVVQEQEEGQPEGSTENGVFIAAYNPGPEPEEEEAPVEGGLEAREAVAEAEADVPEAHAQELIAEEDVEEKQAEELIAEEDVGEIHRQELLAQEEAAEKQAQELIAEEDIGEVHNE